MTAGRAKILVTGSMGQVGWELRRTLPALGEVVALGKDEMDLTRPDEIVRLLKDGPQILALAHTVRTEPGQTEP